MNGFMYTNHAVDRFKERFPALMEKGVHVKVTLHRLMQSATRERASSNDSRRLVYMMEKYGDWNFDYFVSGDVVFVAREDRVVTVIDRHDGGMKKLLGSNKPNYKKRPPAEMAW